MRAVFSSFVAVSLLVHAAFGCCWHHVHEAECEAKHCDSVLVETTHPHALQFAGGHSHECDPSHSPAKERSHCHGACQYLPGQKVQLEKFSPLITLELAIAAPAIIDAQIAAKVIGGLSLDAPAQPPLRLHLFHQILLI